MDSGGGGYHARGQRVAVWRHRNCGSDAGGGCGGGDDLGGGGEGGGGRVRRGNVGQRRGGGPDRGRSEVARSGIDIV